MKIQEITIQQVQPFRIPTEQIERVRRTTATAPPTDDTAAAPTAGADAATGDAAGAAPTDRERRGAAPRSVGVLYVHGIGDQATGATLLQGGEPTLWMLDQWAARQGASVRVTQSSLHGGPEGVPAHATVQVRTRDMPGEATLVLAESTWAHAFDAPSVGSVVRWGVAVVPWLTLTQFLDRIRLELAGMTSLSMETVRRTLRTALAALGLAIAFPLAAAVQLVALLIIPLSLVPALAWFVAPIQRVLSAYIGDAYVLLTSRLRFQGMVDCVKHDAGWLADRTDAVVVIAHSQGAAVAHEALRQSADTRVESFFTIGGAVARLRALRLAMDLAPEVLLGATFLTLGALGLLGFYLREVFAAPVAPGTIVSMATTLIVLPIVACSVLPFSLRDMLTTAAWRSDLDLGGTLRWTDLYAALDPVPNGPLPAAPRSCVSLKVENLASLLLDHTTYWRNREEVLQSIVDDVLWRMRLSPGQAAAPPAPDAPSPRRESRVGWLVAARAATVATLFTILLLRPWLASVSERFVLDAGVAHSVGQFIPAWALALVFTPAGSLRWSVLAVLIPAISYAALRIGWGSWDRRAGRAGRGHPVLPFAIALIVVLAADAGALMWWFSAETARAMAVAKAAVYAGAGAVTSVLVMAAYLLAANPAFWNWLMEQTGMLPRVTYPFGTVPSSTTFGAPGRASGPIPPPAHQKPFARDQSVAAAGRSHRPTDRVPSATAPREPATAALATAPVGEGVPPLPAHPAGLPILTGPGARAIYERIARDVAREEERTPAVFGISSAVLGGAALWLACVTPGYPPWWSAHFAFGAALLAAMWGVAGAVRPRNGVLRALAYAGMFSGPVSLGARAGETTAFGTAAFWVAVALSSILATFVWSSAALVRRAETRLG